MSYVYHVLCEYGKGWIQGCLRKMEAKKMNKMRTRVLLAFIIISVMLTAVPIYAASVKLNKTAVSVYVGNTKTIKVQGTNKKVSWSSTNKSIATVSKKGVVKGIKAGKAIIKAKVGGKTYKCTVTVKNTVELSGYKGKKISSVKKAFPKWKGYKWHFMEHWTDNAGGARFLAPNTDYECSDNHRVTIINLQPDASKKYTICGMQIGLSKAKMLAKAKEKGWKIAVINPSNIIRSSGEEIIQFKSRQGWYLEVDLKDGKTWMITYSKDNS